MSDERRLIKLAKNGDTAAFEKLIKHYDNSVLRIAASYRNDVEDAKDIYQEVFMRVFKGLKNFEFRSEFSTWFYRITVNVCLTHDIKKKKHMAVSINKTIVKDDDGGGLTIEDLLENKDKADDVTLKNEMRLRIEKSLNGLPSQQRMAFTLKNLEGYKIKEISKMMNCAEGTIKRYLFNASKRMRTELKNFI